MRNGKIRMSMKQAYSIKTGDMMLGQCFRKRKNSLHDRSGDAEEGVLKI